MPNGLSFVERKGDILASEVSLIKGREPLKGNVTSSEAVPIPDLDPRQAIEQSEPLIHLHLEKRISLQFLQFVLCYRTNYQFREGRTLHQGFNAGAVNGIKCQAAHSATLPCIYAKSGDKEMVFLYRSGYYDESNSTIDMVKAVNDADRAIDEKCSTSLLREKTVALLNRVAGEELTPKDALFLYLIDLKEEIDVALKRETSKDVLSVLERYGEKARSVEDHLNDPNHVDRLLNLLMDDPDTPNLSFVVEQIKTSTPVERTEILRLIQRKISDLALVVLCQWKIDYNEHRTPPHFRDLFYKRVLSQFRNKNLAVVEEATGRSLEELRRSAKSFRYLGSSPDVLDHSADKIDDVAREVLNLARSACGRRIPRSSVKNLSSEKKRALRPKVYSLRYGIIGKDQAAQSAIKKKIAQVFASVTGRYKEDFFYHALFERAEEKGIALQLCRLLNLSKTEVARNVRELQVNQSLHRHLESNASRISEMSQLVSMNDHKESILDIVSSITQGVSSRKNREKLNFFIFQRLMDNANSSKEKRFIEKVFEDLDRDGTKAKNKGKVERSVYDKDFQIREIVDVAKDEIDRLNREIATFRSKMFVELRESNGMTQEQFRKVYIKEYPIYPMSAGTLSNLENGIKPFDAEIVEQACKIFGVDDSLFSPSTFSEQ